MNAIQINETHSTPLFSYGEEGRLVIKGRSLPEDAARFYNPLIQWAREVKDPIIMADITLEYMNSASSKKMLELLKVLDANSHIRELNITWFYEEGDDDSLESGQIYEELLLKARFRYKQYQEFD